MSLPSTAAPNGRRTRFIQPQGLYDATANGYSHLVIAEAPARHIYSAGQGGENARGEPSMCDLNSTPSSVTLRRLLRLKTWNPPESVNMGRFQLMKVCTPPMRAINSCPGRR